MEKPNINQGKVTPIKTRPVQQKWSSKKKIVVYIISGIIAFFVFIFVIASLATSGPLKVSDEFIDNIQTNNASAAYDLMSSEAQIATSSQDFSAVVDKISPILTGEPKNTDKEVSAETGSDSTAEILYEVKGSDGYTYELSVQLINNDGQWEVQGFNSEKQ